MVLIIFYVPVMLSQISLIAYRTIRKAHQKVVKVERTFLAPVRVTYNHSKLKVAKELALGEHTVANVLIAGSLVVNAAYVALYWRRTHLLSEICLDQYSPEWIIELVFSVYFLLYFCLRMYGGYNRREFWFSRKTLIDIVTIPHIFVSVALERDWLGFRFLRIMWFNHLVDLLKQLPIFKSQQWIDIFSLLLRFITVWFAYAAAIHLLEVTGDPWHDFETRHCDLRLFDYVYFMIVTISTVGYGDISPNTDAGRALISLMIIVGIIMVAYATPTISEIFKSYSLYSGSYTEVTDAKHVVVSGYITAESVKNFLSDFLHPDRKDNYTKVLLLDPKEPNYELKAIIRKHFRHVRYFKGSVLNNRDLERVKVKTASAFVILSPNYCLNPVSEDESNLMRVVSIKNTRNEAKIIVQMLQLHSLRQVVLIPSWHPSIDTAICKSELKLGLMAQNCLCPGISTLLSNLMYTTSESAGTHEWEQEYSVGKYNYAFCIIITAKCYNIYILGAGYEVYKHMLPEAFYGKTYEEVARLCFMNPDLYIMLIAIDATSVNQSEKLIYPAPFGFEINKGMSGYFIAQNEEEVLALNTLTSENLATYRSQGSTKSLPKSQPTREVEDTIPLTGITIEVTTDDWQENNDRLRVNKPQIRSPGSSAYHKCAERDFEEALIEESTDMRGHIILCTFTLQDSDELNLHSFVSPLRARTLLVYELKPILIIGNKDCIQNEWSNIAEFDNVFVIDGSPLDQDVLKAANIANCSSCIILGSTASLDEDPALIDKQPILCSLTLTSLDFKDAMSETLSGKYIHKVTELYKDENVQFLDLEDEDDSMAGFINSQPFAQGECISSTVFDSLVAVAYFNPGATALFKKLVTGGSVNRAKPKQKGSKRATCRFTVSTAPDPKPSLYRPRFLQISLEKPDYQKFHGYKFFELFEALLEEKQLCIGIYRRINENNAFSKRYVITSPSHYMQLKPSDNIFVLVTCK